MAIKKKKKKNGATLEDTDEEEIGPAWQQVLEIHYIILSTFEYAVVFFPRPHAHHKEVPGPGTDLVPLKPTQPIQQQQQCQILNPLLQTRAPTHTTETRSCTTEGTPEYRFFGGFGGRWVVCFWACPWHAKTPR